MKKLLILPGNSSRNRTWGEECAEFFAEQFDEIYLQLYDHWETGEEWMDVVSETEKIANTVTGCDDDGEWYVCAKSMGSVLALMAIQADVIEPEKCVFFGMPLDKAENKFFKGDWSSLIDYRVPTLVFHHNHDPVANCDFTAQKLMELGQNITFRKLPGNNHDYIDFAVYQVEIEDFLP